MLQAKKLFSNNNIRRYTDLMVSVVNGDPQNAKKIGLPSLCLRFKNAGLVKEDGLVKSPLLRHSRAGGNPECVEMTGSKSTLSPACAGMTGWCRIIPYEEISRTVSWEAININLFFLQFVSNA